MQDVAYSRSETQAAGEEVRYVFDGRGQRHVSVSCARTAKKGEWK